MSAIRRSASGSPTTVGASNAKTHFSELLERVARGEEITLTNHDRPVAHLVHAGPIHALPPI